MAPSSKLIFLVTGANRGIGFSTVQTLSLRYPDGTYIIGCRNISSGQQAVQELRKLGVKATLDVVELDVTNDSTVEAAQGWVREKFGRLDVLVNNAGIALFPESSSPTAIREFQPNIQHEYHLPLLRDQAFLPLLHLSSAPKVINISSGRASLQRSSDCKLPPTKVVSYSISKAAVNSLTIEMQKIEDALAGEEKGEGEVGKGKMEFLAANLGHCKTAFNGSKGEKST
ncbi:hypothetical protein BKA61DRAFT_474729 [Leptodontidium sp. MPI-SDFR-AT-0119]|nr:hypothetical protein BKA61DRAFT_474729 [Leptodontidium sp. MPI-SDFR-AT-0119]